MKVESFQPKEKIVPIPDGSSFFILGKKNWYFMFNIFKHDLAIDDGCY